MTPRSALKGRKHEPVTTDRFADFFYSASEKEKQRVFRKAARQANEDQRKVFEQAKLAA